MTDKYFRIDWYVQEAFIGLSHLNVEQIGLLIQIMNYIYIKNGPVDRDDEFFAKSCNIRKGRCTRITNELLKLHAIYLTVDGKISQKRCELELKSVEKRIEIASKNGKKGAETRWQSQEKQSLNNGATTVEGMPNTNTNTQTNIKTTTNQTQVQEGKVNIDALLTDDARKKAAENSPGWDQQYLMRKYDEEIRSGRLPDIRYPNIFYPGWVLKYTKGKRPS